VKPRRPDLDFSNLSPHWAAIPEFAQGFNASSSFIPQLEPFLNRVMVMARAKIKGDDAASEQLRKDITIFIQQEANHYTLHGAFNSALAKAGYDRLPEFEKGLGAEFADWLKTKSLKFLTAYCEGFETLGPPYARVWLDEIEDLLVGADKNVVGLWKWHLLEEYEHRTVCHDVYHRLYGGYFYRIYGLIFQMRHLGGYSKMVKKYLLARDRANMTPDEVAASIKREKQVGRRLARLALPRLLRAFSPFYTPRSCPEPKMFRDYMAKVEAGLAKQASA